MSKIRVFTSRPGSNIAITIAAFFLTLAIVILQGQSVTNSAKRTVDQVRVGQQANNRLCPSPPVAFHPPPITSTKCLLQQQGVDATALATLIATLDADSSTFNETLKRLLQGISVQIDQDGNPAIVIPSPVPIVVRPSLGGGGASPSAPRAPSSRASTSRPPTPSATPRPTTAPAGPTPGAPASPTPVHPLCVFNVCPLG